MPRYQDYYDPAQPFGPKGPRYPFLDPNAKEEQKQALINNNNGKAPSSAVPVNTAPTGGYGAGMSVDERRDASAAARLGNGGVGSLPANPPPRQRTLIDDLLDQLGQNYPGSTRTPDFTAMDEALKQRLGVFEDTRNKAQQGFNTSDANLKAMFEANANDIATRGAQRFRDIGNEQTAGINSLRDASIAQLKADQADQMARRTAMLKNLGIEAAAPALTSTDEEFAKAISGAGTRANTALTQAQGNAAANQELNASTVNSINQQGTERRAALAQQLAGILGKLSTGEAEVKNQDQVQRSQMAQGINQSDYKLWNDRQNRIMDIYRTVNQNEQNAAKINSKAQQPGKSQGVEGLQQDLINANVPPEQAGQYMGVLSQVLADPATKVDQFAGYTLAQVLMRQLKLRQPDMPDAIAMRIATNYANLGNTSSYTDTTGG